MYKCDFFLKNIIYRCRYRYQTQQNFFLKKKKQRKLSSKRSYCDARKKGMLTPVQPLNLGVTRKMGLSLGNMPWSLTERFSELMLESRMGD